MARFITNPGGAVHSVEAGEFDRLTRLPGYRESTAEEIAAWHTQQGLPLPTEAATEAPADESAPETRDAPDNQDTAHEPDPPSGGAKPGARKSRR